MVSHAEIIIAAIARVVFLRGIEKVCNLFLFQSLRMVNLTKF